MLTLLVLALATCSSSFAVQPLVARRACAAPVSLAMKQAPVEEKKGACRRHDPVHSIPCGCRVHGRGHARCVCTPLDAGFSLFGFGKSDAVEGKVVPTGKGEEEEELSESKKLLQQVKDAGVAGIISYIFWEWAFWGVSVPVCIYGYYVATGHLCARSSRRHWFGLLRTG